MTAWANNPSLPPGRMRRVFGVARAHGYKWHEWYARTDRVRRAPGYVARPLQPPTAWERRTPTTTGGQHDTDGFAAAHLELKKSSSSRPSRTWPCVACFRRGRKGLYLLRKRILSIHLTLVFK